MFHGLYGLRGIRQVARVLMLIRLCVRSSYPGCLHAGLWARLYVVLCRQQV